MREPTPSLSAEQRGMGRIIKVGTYNITTKIIEELLRRWRAHKMGNKKLIDVGGRDAKLRFSTMSSIHDNFACI